MGSTTIAPIMYFNLILLMDRAQPMAMGYNAITVGPTPALQNVATPCTDAAAAAAATAAGSEAVPKENMVVSTNSNASSRMFTWHVPSTLATNG